MPTKRELRLAAKALEMGACHILIKHSGCRNPVSKRNGQPIVISREEALAEAEGILSAGLNPDNFKQTATDRSECASAADGGDLGRFGPGKMVPAFEEATKILEVGAMSGVVETESGFHIILRYA